MWTEICKILNVNPDDSNPKWNPKNYQQIDLCKEKLKELLGNKKDAEEIIEMALVGELSILKNKYPY